MTRAKAVRSVGIVAKPRALEARPVLENLIACLEAHSVRYALDREAARIVRHARGQDRQAIAASKDVVVVLGGDGTLLSIARSAAHARTLILGVNLGSLGFLTEIPRERAIEELERVLAGKSRIEERMMLELRILRNGRTVRRECALNDVVISKQSTIARSMDLSVEVDGSYVTAYRSDGLIVATPTGSTAYSLSAGGPILDPLLDVLILNPICPHTLTHRPLVLRDTVTVDVAVTRSDDGVFLTLDGQTGYPVRGGDRVRIGRSPKRVRLAIAKDRDYFHLLRSKLKWGERLTR